MVSVLAVTIAQPVAFGADSSGSTISRDPRSSRDREIQDIKREIRALEHRVDELESQNSRLEKTNAELKADAAKSQASAAREIQAIESKSASESSPASFASAMNHYLGSNRFTIVGGAAASFIYDRKSAINTYSLQFEPLLLWQLNDWMLFEGTVKASLPAGTGASYDLPVASLQMFLNDYAELYAGIFDQPFGNFYEDQSAFWTNRFVTAPLPYGINPLVPPSELGAQLRGGFQWGSSGQIADYTVWSGNGPGFSQSGCSDNTPPSPLPSCPPTALVGDSLVAVNNIRLNTHTPAFGARFRVYPLPADSTMGRLELGASTYDGKWSDGLWFKSWGVDFNYLRNNLQARGEWIQNYRQMPGVIGSDNRQGWYVQAGYFLSGLRVPGLPSVADNYLDKFEPLVRYSGVNQRAAVLSEMITTPSIGFSGSPAAFAPHAREVALGLDYWFAPSIVWQNEFDLELPRAGGFFSDTGTPVGATSNDRAFLSQLAVGF